MKKLVGYQGNKGAYSEKAASLMYPGYESIGYRTLTDAFVAIKEGMLNVAVIPVENSSIGTITKSLDLMDEFKFQVMGEYFMPIRHFLIGPKGTDLKNVENVYSHPAALDQCQKYLSQFKNWQLIPVNDTAGAVKLISEKALTDSVAIAGELTSDIYGLDIIDEHINDFEHNQTRFWAIGQNDNYKILPIEKRNKMSIVVRLDHRAGALHNFLGVMNMLNINLTSLISRPNKDNPWFYIFFIDLELNSTDRRIPLIQDNLKYLGIKFHSLGDYGTLKVS